MMEKPDPPKTGTVPSQVVEYYRKYSQNRKLAAYFCGDPFNLETIGSSSGPALSINVISPEPVQVVETADCPQRPPLIGEDHADEAPPDNIEDVRNPSPTSSVTSNRKLEWDNGADIGYHNCQKNLILHKSASLPALVSLEKQELRKNFLRLSPEVNLVYYSDAGRHNDGYTEEIPGASRKEQVEHSSGNVDSSKENVRECQETKGRKDFLRLSPEGNITESSTQTNQQQSSGTQTNQQQSSSTTSSSDNVKSRNLDYTSATSTSESVHNQNRVVESTSSSSYASKPNKNPSTDSESSSNVEVTNNILSLLKRKVGLPLAESTPTYRFYERKSDPSVYTSTPVLQKVRATNVSGKEEIADSKLINTTSTSANTKVTVSTDQRTDVTDSVTGKDESKKMTNISDNGSAVKLQATNLDMNGSLRYRKKRLMRLLITKPLSVECVGYIKSQDKDIQTTLMLNASVGVQTESNNFDVKEHVTDAQGEPSYVDRQSVIFVQYSDSDKEPSTRSLGTNTYSSSDVVISDCNSFKYVYGEECENLKQSTHKADKTSTESSTSVSETADKGSSSLNNLKRSQVKSDLTVVSSESNATNASSETGVLGNLIANKHSNSLITDVDKSIELVHKLLKSKKYDNATKRYYLKKIVQKILNSTYHSDSSTSSEPVQNATTSTSRNVENIKDQLKTFNDAVDKERSKTEQRNLQDNLPWVPATFQKGETNSQRPKQLDIRTFSAEILPDSAGNENAFQVESSQRPASSKLLKDRRFTLPSTYSLAREHKPTHYKLQSSTDHSSLNEIYDNPQKFILPQTTDLSSETERDFGLSNTRAFTNWKESKTRSERLLEQRRTDKSSGDALTNPTDADLLLHFAKKERENQISWINSEITHLSKLKTMLQKKKMDVEVLTKPHVEDMKNLKKSTSVYVITTEKSDSSTNGSYNQFRTKFKQRMSSSTNSGSCPCQCQCQKSKDFSPCTSQTCPNLNPYVRPLNHDSSKLSARSNGSEREAASKQNASESEPNALVQDSTLAMAGIDLSADMRNARLISSEVYKNESNPGTCIRRYVFEIPVEFDPCRCDSNEEPGNVVTANGGAHSPASSKTQVKKCSRKCRGIKSSKDLEQIQNNVSREIVQSALENCVNCCSHMTKTTEHKKIEPSGSEFTTKTTELKKFCPSGSENITRIIEHRKVGSSGSEYSAKTTLHGKVSPTRGDVMRKELECGVNCTTQTCPHKKVCISQEDTQRNLECSVECQSQRDHYETASRRYSDTQERRLQCNLNCPKQPCEHKRVGSSRADNGRTLECSFEYQSQTNSDKANYVDIKARSLERGYSCSTQTCDHKKVGASCAGVQARTLEFAVALSTQTSPNTKTGRSQADLKTTKSSQHKKLAMCSDDCTGIKSTKSQTISSDESEPEELDNDRPKTADSHTQSGRQSPASKGISKREPKTEKENKLIQTTASLEETSKAVEDSSSSSSSLSSESSSSDSAPLYVCPCCKKNNARYKVSELASNLASGVQPVLCRPCHRQNMQMNWPNQVGQKPYYSYPDHVCNCYTMLKTETMQQIKRTVAELEDMERENERCTCAHKNRNLRQCKCNCKGKSKRKKSVAYTLTFEEDDQETEDESKKKRSMEEIKIKIPSYHKKKQKDKENKRRSGKENASHHKRHKKHSHKKHKKTKPLTLQEHLCMNRPNFIESAEQRRKCMIDLAYLREKRCQKYKQLLALTTGYPTRKYEDEDTKSKRVFTSKQMKDITAKHYKKLPEVQQKLIDHREQQVKTANRILADIFNRKLRESVLKGKHTLSTSTSVIKLN